MCMWVTFACEFFFFFLRLEFCNSFNMWLDFKVYFYTWFQVDSQKCTKDVLLSFYFNNFFLQTKFG
jgi:hypothetical protein